MWSASVTGAPFLSCPLLFMTTLQLIHRNTNLEYYRKLLAKGIPISGNKFQKR